VKHSHRPSIALLLAVLAQAQDPAAPPREPMLLPQAVVLPRGDREIAIDGSLIDWPELPAMRLDDQRQLSGTALRAWHGPNDLSAHAFAQWDVDHLYVAVVVKDEWHRPLDANALLVTEIPPADSVVLTFDPERDTRSLGADPGRAEDREFWLADENGREVVQWDRLRGSARVLDPASARMVVLHSDEQGITTYEARIPWSEILPVGRKAEAGLVVDAQIVVSDFDEATDPMPQTRIGWTFGCGAVVDPGLLGSMMLVADREALRGIVPEFPPKPGTKGPPLPSADHWHDLTARLLARPPAVHDGTVAPEEAGGIARLAVLEEIDEHCERFPRVDYLEFTARIQRRMSREVAGIAARGLPSFWRERLRALSKAAEDPVPNRAVRIFRIPQGGWLVRGAQRSFAIDAAGADLAEWLWGGVEMLILTQPLDVARRNDQLAVRMLLNKPPRPVLTHIAFHLPAVAMADLPLTEPGGEYGDTAGPRIRASGAKTADGSVSRSCSYRIEIPSGPVLLVTGPDARPADMVPGHVDVMIVSPHNPAAPQLVARVAPELVLIDDAFGCSTSPNVARVQLREIHGLQRALQPRPSLVLAPGESWDVTAKEPAAARQSDK
jgi:hypothetical protein